MKAPPLKYLYKIQTQSTNVGWIYNYISIHPYIRMSRPRPMLFSFRILGREGKFIFLTFSNKFCFQTQQKTSHCSQCLASFLNQPCSGKGIFFRLACNLFCRELNRCFQDRSKYGYHF